MSVCSQPNRARFSFRGHSLPCSGQARGGERWSNCVRAAVDLTVWAFQESSLPVVGVVWQDGFTQHAPVGMIHVPPGDLRSVLVGIGQERCEPQLLKLPRVRVIADKHVDQLAPERPAYGPFLVKDGERPEADRRPVPSRTDRRPRPRTRR